MTTDDYREAEYDLSASRVKTHAMCPKRYELQYLQEAEPTKAKKGFGQLGSWVHTAIENVLAKNPNERNQKALNANFKREFFRLSDTDEVNIEKVDEKQKSTGLDCLKVAARFISETYPEKFAGGQNYKISNLEKPINFHIDNPDIDRTIYGKIDVIANNEIWDWKTGRIREYTDREELIQGSIYMAGYHNEFGKLPDAIRFIYLKEEKQREIDPTQDSWRDMLNHARELVNNEKTGDFPAKPEQSKCYFCDVEMWCPASQVGAGAISYEQF